ncbi:FAD-binding oxidoreductase [Filimonas effusa]|uniref:Siderophore-interacting protein n=1 Tax=Filimonas effusa TaxID=2508721 RepID=A0A4Q1D244_9BACT|nr:FAD-binding oxidoreductase [Filimonas effusa]RXK81946.1 siderophore-interacting protein [Filimonas effusa]
MPRAAKWFGDVVESLMASKMPVLTVTEACYVNPRMKRIRLEGDLNGLDFQLGYAIFIRVSDTEYRNYTASFADVKNGILELLVFLHSDAPGCRFIKKLHAGDKVRIGMPRGIKQYNAAIQRQVFFGDETSLALACSFYSFLKKNDHIFRFYFELDASSEDLPRLLGLENFIIFSKENLKRELPALPFFLQPEWLDANFILTGNVQSVQTCKKLLKKNNVRGRIFAQGYWMEGKTGL